MSAAVAIVSLIALNFGAFGNSLQELSMDSGQNPHDAMRFAMWHKVHKSVCALVLAIVNRPRHHDRFVLLRPEPDASSFMERPRH